MENKASTSTGTRLMIPLARGGLFARPLGVIFGKVLAADSTVAALWEGSWDVGALFPDPFV